MITWPSVNSTRTGTGSRTLSWLTGRSGTVSGCEWAVVAGTAAGTALAAGRRTIEAATHAGGEGAQPTYVAPPTSSRAKRNMAASPSTMTRIASQRCRRSHQAARKKAGHASSRYRFMAYTFPALGQGEPKPAQGRAEGGPDRHQAVHDLHPGADLGHRRGPDPQLGQHAPAQPPHQRPVAAQRVRGPVPPVQGLHVHVEQGIAERRPGVDGEGGDARQQHGHPEQ